MTASQRVIPTQPLVAERQPAGHWWIEVRPIITGDNIDYALGDLSLSDDEYHAAFMPAEPLEALLAAVGEWAECTTDATEFPLSDLRLDRLDDATAELLAAYRAYVEAKP